MCMKKVQMNRAALLKRSKSLLLDKTLNLSSNLSQENQKLKEENSRLKEALELHRFCSVSLQPESTNPFEMVSAALTKTPQLKIIPFDPREILRLQSEQVIRQRLGGSEVVTGPRDILREATEHILLEADQPQKSHHGEF